MINNNVLGLDKDSVWLSNTAYSAHWARLELPIEATVTSFQLASLTADFFRPEYKYGDCGVIVGNDLNVQSAANSICKIFGQHQVSDVLTTFNCRAPVTGKYIFVSNRYAMWDAVTQSSGSGVDISISELKVQGYRVLSTYCAACTAGKYKDVTGNSACTNCRANTYSNFTAARNASVCTPCYNNALANAGSTSIWDCGCESGFQFEW